MRLGGSYAALKTNPWFDNFEWDALYNKTIQPPYIPPREKLISPDFIEKKYKEELVIKTPNLNQIVKNLSGGNQQKVILGKWLAANSELIIFDEPTRGIDVGAKYEIYKLINSLVENGKTILLISSEMEELMGMSDRIIVLAEGNITGEQRREEFDQTSIMRLASAMKEVRIKNENTGS